VKDDVWAVKKKGGKRAVPAGLHTTEDSAISFIGDMPGLEIEYRPGEDVRCLNYCPVNKWCSYWKERYSEKHTVA